MAAQPSRGEGDALLVRRLWHLSGLGRNVKANAATPYRNIQNSSRSMGRQLGLASLSQSGTAGLKSASVSQLNNVPRK